MKLLLLLILVVACSKNGQEVYKLNSGDAWVCKCDDSATGNDSYFLFEGVEAQKNAHAKCATLDNFCMDKK
jgi:hypothetical protein